MTHKPARTIAIGDIHGCSQALKAILTAIDPVADDIIVTLGDYVNRGPDAKGVLDHLLGLADRCQLIPLMGNHEEMTLAAREGRSDLEYWLKFGGDATLKSYGEGVGLDALPQDHLEFIQSCRDYYETVTHFFVHASYIPNFPLDQQSSLALRWEPISCGGVPAPHYSGKIAVVGHTPYEQVLNFGHLICLDTNCCEGGWLSALDVDSGQLWQANQTGELVEKALPEAN